jgi:hypothetical protein
MAKPQTSAIYCHYLMTDLVTRVKIPTIQGLNIHASILSLFSENLLFACEVPAINSDFCAFEIHNEQFGR